MNVMQTPHSRRSGDRVGARQSDTPPSALESQQDILLQALRTSFSEGMDYALLDFPNFSNVGDSAIWLGERRLLRELTGRDPAYVSTGKAFDAEQMERAVPQGPIVLHGGGNLGDLWLNHQELREHLLTRFPTRQIVQLPQSIKFQDQQNVERFAGLVRRHGNFTLLVRDRASHEFAKRELGIEPFLTPDCAVFLGRQKHPVQPSYDTVLLLRTDIEATGASYQAFKNLDNSKTFDWIEEPKLLYRKARGRSLVSALMRGVVDHNTKRVMLYDHLAKARVQRGLRMLSQGNSVITDRLHGHILSTLLDLPHVTLDNNYGKVSGYASLWGGAASQHQSVNTSEEAVSALGNLK